MRLLLISIFVFLLYSCRNSSIQYNLASVQSKTTGNVRIDTIRINKILSLNEPRVKILKEGLYHQGEINPNLLHRSWKGLFANDNRNYISDVSVKIVPAFDDMMDEPGKKTGILVKAINEDTSILLISGLPLKNIPVKRLGSYLQVLPGEKINFKYKNNTYRLYATGEKKLDSVSKAYNITAYKLFVETTLNRHHYIQLLVDIPAYEGPFHTIIKFIGDIDNDGVPDLIIDTSNYYGGENSTLFLSHPSKTNVLYTIAGGITATA